MPGIDELLRAEGERWRDEVDRQVDTYPEPAEVRSRRPWSTPQGKVWTASLGAVAAAAVVLLAVGLATGSDGSGSSNTRTLAGNGSAASGAGGSSSDVDSAQDKIAAPAAGAARPPGSTAPRTTPVSSASLILTGSVSLTVADNAAVSRAATRATGIADGAGGRVDADSRSTSGGRATSSATLVLRVPNTALPAVRTQLATLGTVRSQDLQTKDVTTQVADVNSRVTSARAAIAGLTRLYAKARTVGELIAVESALTARQSDLEALEAQQRTLSAQTSLATLTVSIDVRAAAAKHHTHHNGFVNGLHHGWDAFTATLRAIATALGAALPFAAVVLVLAAAGVLALRRRRRPARTLSAPAPE